MKEMLGGVKKGRKSGVFFKSTEAVPESYKATGLNGRIQRLEDRNEFE